MDKSEVLRQMIADKQRQVQLYQAIIEEWERELGSPSSQGLSESHVAGAASTKKENGGDILDTIRDWQFFNKSQPEAARMVLELAGHPLKTQTLMDAIEKGGVKVGGKTPKDKKQNFYTILRRNKELGRAARDTWGLLSWPNVTRKQDEDEEEPNGKTASE